MVRRRMEIMRTGNQWFFAIVASVLCISRVSTAATPRTPTSMIIQISPESSYLDLSSSNRAATLRQTSTPVRVTLTGAIAGYTRPIEIYVCVPTDEAMRLSGSSMILAIASLRIRNDQGEWAAMEPLPELDGCRGVRVAVLSRTSTTILLQLQLEVPARQAPGIYQGVLMLEALER